MKGKLSTPDQQRATQEMQDKALRAWAADYQIGTKPQSFVEKVRSPIKSTKNIKR